MKRVQFINHDIRGTSGAYGFEGLTVLSKSMSGIYEDVIQAWAIVNQMEDYLAAVKIKPRTRNKSS